MEPTLSNVAGIALAALVLAAIAFLGWSIFGSNPPYESIQVRIVQDAELSSRSHEAIVELALAALVAANTSNHKLAAELQRRGEGRSRAC